MKEDFNKLTKSPVSDKGWEDWRWQQKNSIRDIRKLSCYFTQIKPQFFKKLYQQSKDLKFQLTPYMLLQIPSDVSESELQSNPWFLQFFPLGEIYREGSDAYDGRENWEFPEEFPTSNIHHKYTNRVLIRFRNCLAYCNFCFEALGSLEKEVKKDKLFKWEDWKKSLEYIANHPDVEEVVLSGGEPLYFPDSKLKQILDDISEIKDKDGKPKIRFKRIHTRALTHNPFRMTDDFVEILKDSRVNDITFDVVHPSEITPEFEDAVYRIREGMGKYSPLLVTHTPLIKGLNADSGVLWELFSKLYELNVKPYYLLHSIPHTPYADKQRVSVKDGVKLMLELKRHKSNIAVPEYIVAHYRGKVTVPLELEGTSNFEYTEDEKGNPIVKFLNWRGNWVEYPDVEDTIEE